VKRLPSTRMLPGITLLLASVASFAAAPPLRAAAEPPTAPTPAPASQPDGPLPALEVVEKPRAAAGKRGVFLGFHASWCTWCRALQRLTLLPAAKPVFDRYYVVAWLTVDERAARKSLENPGADGLRTRLGGDGVALPFYAVIDPSGKVTGTSVRSGLDGRKENIGFPGTPDEVQDFLTMFRSGAPDLTAAEEKILTDAVASLVGR
jgi:thiol:disulfide interchange protein